jgi:hypothetical protein
MNTPVLNVSLLLRVMQNSHWDQEHCIVLACRGSDHTEGANREGSVDTSPEEADWGSVAFRADLGHCRASRVVGTRGWSAGQWMDL